MAGALVWCLALFVDGRSLSVQPTLLVMALPPLACAWANLCPGHKLDIFGAHSMLREKNCQDLLALVRHEEGRGRYIPTCEEARDTTVTRTNNDNSNNSSNNVKSTTTKNGNLGEDSAVSYLNSGIYTLDINVLPIRSVQHLTL